MKYLASLTCLVLTVCPSISLAGGPVETLQTILDIWMYSDFVEKEPRSHIHELIDITAQRYGLKPNFLRAIVANESDFDPSATSEAGAIGLCQLMPGTASELGVNPYSIAENLDGGARYISGLLDKYGNVRRALWAYNAGPTRIDSGKGVPAETLDYAEDVLEKFRSYQNEK